ncbi:MAG: putative adenosine monophosphate-protein transferase Fic [Gallionella sp.]
MDKYDAANDYYCYPSSIVLKNKLNIVDINTLEAAEREITAETVKAISYQSPPYSLDYMKKLHRDLFSELYDWAGELRTVDIAKGGTRFCTCGRILPEAEKLFKSLAKENWLNSLSKVDFCKKLAEHYCEFNMIHPFREGNGRVQRLLFEHLALSAGYELDWENINQDEWIHANIDGVVNDEPMADIFNRIVCRLD